VIDWVIWIAAGIALLIAEVILPGVFMMWLGLAACGAGVLTMAFHFAFAAQVIAFGILTAVALAVALRLPRGHRLVKTEQEGLIGRPVTALVFDGRDGRVRLGDTDWPARVPPGVPPPDPGARLRVEKVDGTVVIVRPDA
jgi:inner membrane protein